MNGAYIFNGRFEDKLHNAGDISGAIALIVGNIVSVYDRNGNGRIDKDEAIKDVIDYFQQNNNQKESFGCGDFLFQGIA